jgi:hypothetical protein
MLLKCPSLIASACNASAQQQPNATAVEGIFCVYLFTFSLTLIGTDEVHIDFSNFGMDPWFFYLSNIPFKGKP